MTATALAVLGALAPAASAERIVAVSDSATPQVVVVDSADPSTPVFGPGVLQGLPVTETVVGIDFRPADGQLYAVTKDAGNVGRLYVLRISGLSIAELDLVDAAGTFPLDAAASYGVDWNPVVDLLRVVSDDGLNLRVDPAAGLVSVDVPLAYEAGDPNFGTPPGVNAVGYTNNFAGATGTLLYAFDPGPNEILSRLASPNNGQLETIRTTASTTSGDQSLDVTATNRVFGSFTNVGNAFLYEVDVDAAAGGIGTQIGDIGNDAEVYRHLSVIPSGFVEVEHGAAREDQDFSVRVVRRGGSRGRVQVDYSTSAFGATPGADLTPVAGTLTFEEGQTEATITVPLLQDQQVEGEDEEQFLVATDRAGRSRTDAVRVFVPRFIARAVSVTVSREDDLGLPSEVRVRGRVVLPRGVEAQAGCENGKVRLVFKHRRKVVTTLKVDLDDECAFDTTRTFADRRSLRGVRTLRVLTRFTGSRHLRPRNAPVRRVRIR